MKPGPWVHCAKGTLGTLRWHICPIAAWGKSLDFNCVIVGPTESVQVPAPNHTQKNKTNFWHPLRHMLLFPLVFHAPLWETALYIKWHANLFFYLMRADFPEPSPPRTNKLATSSLPIIYSPNTLSYAKKQDFWSTGFKWFVALRRCVLHCLISCVVILVTQGARQRTQISTETENKAKWNLKDREESWIVLWKLLSVNWRSIATL